MGAAGSRVRLPVQNRRVFAVTPTRFHTTSAPHAPAANTPEACLSIWAMADLHDGHDGMDLDHGNGYLVNGGDERDSPVQQPSDQLPAEDDEDTEISEDLGLARSAGRAAALAKRKTAAMLERMAARDAQMPSLAQGVEQLLNMDIGHLKKRGRSEASDSAVDPDTTDRRNRRKKDEGFNAASLIGSIFMRVQGTKAPAPLVYFEEDIHHPQWFKESIDGVQPVMGSDDFDTDEVNLESMGKLVDGNVLPATLTEVAAYFTHVLGDPRTNKEVNPRVLIAIQCDRAKGWFTYKRDVDNSNFVPVVLCAAENGRGLEEVSPAHFEVHRAQCAQKKWRQSFKVLGAQKLHKVTSLAQAALGDVLRHLERILGADKAIPVHRPPAEPSMVTRTVSGVMAPFRPSHLEAALDEQVRSAGPSRMTADGLVPDLVSDQDTVRRLLSSTAGAGGGGMLPRVVPAGGTPGRMLPAAVGPRLMPPLPVGSRLVVGGKPILRRATDPADPVAAAPARHVLGTAAQGLEAMATAASNAIVSPGGPAGVQAGLLAAALSGVSFNELLQLVIDNTARKQQHAQQAALLQQLAALQTQQAAQDKIAVAAAVEATASGQQGASGSGAPGAQAVASASGALSPAECDAINVIMRGVRGPDVSHAVRGILQHVAMQYAGEQPSKGAAAPALAEALTQAAQREGMVNEVTAAAESQPEQEAMVQPAAGDTVGDDAALGAVDGSANHAADAS